MNNTDQSNANPEAGTVQNFDAAAAAAAAEAKAREDAIVRSAQANPAMVAAAGITNGMPPDEQRRRLLLVATGQV